MLHINNFLTIFFKKISHKKEACFIVHNSSANSAFMKKWMELRRTEMIMKQKLHSISIFESLFRDFCRLFTKMVNDSGDFIIQVCAYSSSKFGNIYNKFSTKKNHVCCVKITAWIYTSCL